MKVTVIGTHLCPDTLEALHQLYKAGADIDFKDILASHGDLRVYLALRDSHEVYKEVRGTDRLGVPCFVLEDGTVTMDLDKAMGK